MVSRFEIQNCSFFLDFLTINAKMSFLLDMVSLSSKSFLKRICMPRGQQVLDPELFFFPRLFDNQFPKWLLSSICFLYQVSFTLNWICMPRVEQILYLELFSFPRLVDNQG